MRCPAAIALAALLAAGCADERARETRESGVHPEGFAERDGHAAFLRAERWAPMLDATRDDACGRCHAGAPSTPESVTIPAPGAPPCSSCHDQREGVLACSTCHGTLGGAHAKHTSGPTELRKLACTTCHPPRDGVAPGTGTHGDGQVDVVVTYADGTCAVGCHDRGGAVPRPSWTGGALGCGDCHGSPPASHPPGECARCHTGVTASANTSALHQNGRVDLGRGGDGCGACHGDGARDPWPSSGRHAFHRDPEIAAPIDCATCHVVPEEVRAPGHIDATDRAEVHLGGPAAARGARPTWDGATCSDVACHGARLPDAPSAVSVRWDDESGQASECGACHGVPPPPPHTQDTGCASLLCHGAVVTPSPAGAGGAPRIAREGRAGHVDGAIDAGGESR